MMPAARTSPRPATSGRSPSRRACRSATTVSLVTPPRIARVAGLDHVDSHRSVLLVVSPYARAGVTHRFVNTTDVLATIEALLHLPPLSSFDEFARPLREIWGATPDLRAYAAARPAQSLDERN